MFQTKRSFSMLLLMAFFGIAGFYWLNLGHADNPPSASIPKEMTSYREVVKKVLPAVVSVRATVANRVPARGERLMPDLRQFDLPDIMRERLEDLFERQPDEGMVRPMPFGSGVIIDPNGIVVTNHHVVAGASSVQISLLDGRIFYSKEIASDPKVDLAIIKLEVKEKLPALMFGNSDAMEIGDRVLAVGAPFGLEGSVTHGIISGKGRRAGMILYEDFLQTDAAINPGNSGGPLVNLAGEVVGISTAIRTTTGMAQGVGLVIPSNLVKDVAQQLSSKGRVVRGYLGIRFGELPPDVAEQMGLSMGKGAVVGQVYPNTPASKAGLQEGDVITAINGQALSDANAVQRTVLATPIGQSLELTVLREGKSLTINVKIEEQPMEYGLRDLPPTMGRRVPNQGQGMEEAIRIDRLGLEVTELTTEWRERLGYAKETKGVLITQVDRGSLAAQAGIRRGHVIVTLDQKPVQSPQALLKVADQASLKKGVVLQIRSPQGTDYVMLREQE